jgi:hypothetical protein
MTFQYLGGKIKSKCDEASKLLEESQDLTVRLLDELKNLHMIQTTLCLALNVSQISFRAEATNTNFIVFGLIRSGLEPTSYHTQSEYANHYITDAVVDSGNMCQIQIDV